MIYLNPGDKVWYPVIGAEVVVQATIDECEDIYANGDKPAIWCRRRLNKPAEVSVPTDKVDELGWNLYDTLDESALQGHERGNQFLWIDEPVGHGIQLDDECFQTLQEALNIIRPTNKKHLKRRLKKSRHRVAKFIVSTWAEKSDVSSLPWMKFPNKKIYVKRNRSR